MEFSKLLVLIPTRNRSDLAMTAIRSVLNQKNCELEIIVSDNSTESEEITNLKFFCLNLNDERLKYINPPEPLPMNKHWDWLIKVVLKTCDFSHATLITDRAIVKPGAFRELKEMLVKTSARVLTYSGDNVDDRKNPVILYQRDFTGKLFEIKSEYIIKSFLEIKWVQPIPTMMNCIVERKVFEELLTKYEKIFESISPDYNFGFKCLEHLNSIFFIDKHFLVGHGFYRSNGANFRAKNPPKDVIDFKKNINLEDLAVNTPLPGFYSPVDAELNEYFNIKKRVDSPKFLEIDTQRYIFKAYEKVLNIQDKKARVEFLDVITKKIGYFRSAVYFVEVKVPLRKALRALSKRIIYLLNPQERIMIMTKFDEVEKAIDYSIKCPRKINPSPRYFQERTGISHLDNLFVKEIQI